MVVVVVVDVGCAVVDVVWVVVVVDEVVGLAALGRVVLVVDWPAVEDSRLEVEVVAGSGAE